MLRIGLDIDDCIADFWNSYCKYFDTKNNPEMLNDNVITRNVQNILRKDRSFWVNLPVLNIPDFKPTLFCTKRVNSKVWTKEWLRVNGFSGIPVYQMIYQHGNKANLIKGKVDVFIDDSPRNAEAMNKAGILTLILDNQRNACTSAHRIHSLTLDAVLEAYKLATEHK